MSYIIVLMCCQRFQEAVLLLWNSAKGFIAAHTTVVLLYYGVILPHIPFDGSATEGSFAGRSTLAPYSLILNWLKISRLVFASPSVALDYIMCLDAKWTEGAGKLSPRVKEAFLADSKKCFRDSLEQFILLLDRDRLTVIVGESREDGPTDARKAGGEIERYFTAEEKSDILRRCAFTALSNRQDVERAIYLFLLSGHYAEVVEEFCKRLSCVLPVAADAEERAFWVKTATNFYSKYIGGGTGRVFQKLQASGSTASAKALELLLNLATMMNLLADNRFEEGMSILDELHILPKNESEVSELAVAAAQFDANVARALSDVLMAVMAAIHYEYRVLRSTVRSSLGPRASAGVLSDADSNARNLQMRARAIVSFADRIKHICSRADLVLALSHIENQLV